MKEKNISKKTAHMITKVLDKMLRVEANSTSCIVIHQPKAPESLERFRKKH